MEWVCPQSDIMKIPKAVRSWNNCSENISEICCFGFYFSRECIEAWA